MKFIEKNFLIFNSFVNYQRLIIKFSKLDINSYTNSKYIYLKYLEYIFSNITMMIFLENPTKFIIA